MFCVMIMNMKIIISPTKQMKMDLGKEYKSLPVFLDQSKTIHEKMKNMSFDELKNMYKASDKIIKEGISFISDMNFENRLTPALFMYDGIQFTYMSPYKMNTQNIAYLERYLRILSGFYGILRPLDGISKYRLEMAHKLDINDSKSLYKFWGQMVYDELFKDEDTVLNLCSEEYGSLIRTNLKKEHTFIDVKFYDLDKGKLVEKGVYCKMARGSMVRFMALNEITKVEDIKKWDEMGFKYDEESSTSTNYVFIRRNSHVEY